MKIYKNFYLYKNTLLVRELNDGIVSKYKLPIKPSYYFVTDKPSKFKSIYGDNLIKLDFENQYEAREWLETYKTQKKNIFGFPHHEYIQINELYPGDLSKVFNIKNFNVSVVDIETKAEGRVYPLTFMLSTKNTITGTIDKMSVKDFERRINEGSAENLLVMQEEDWVKYENSIYYPPGGWPDHELANEEINLISLSIKGPSNKHNNDFFIKTFGTKDVKLDEEDSKDTEYVYCTDEHELLKLFVEYWMTLDIDIISGWNCIPLSQSVWLHNKITTMGKLTYDNKELYDSTLVNKFPTTKKEEVIVKLANGKELKSSKDHIFPYMIKDKTKYISDISKLPKYEGTIEEISKLIDKNDIYFINKLNTNNNKDLTIRNLICNNIDMLTDNGLDVIIRTPKITRLLGKSLNYSICGTKKRSMFIYRNLVNHISKDILVNELNTLQKISVKREDGKKSIELDLDYTLSNDDLWFTGLWYTDGTNSYKTEVTITNTDKELMCKLSSYLNKNMPNSKIYKNKLNAQPYYSITTNLNSRYEVLLKSFIYNKCNVKSKKNINVELLSQLSNSQFMSFMAGCIDGDGSLFKLENNKISYRLCNYNNDISNFQELLEWNGVYSSISNNNILFKTYLPDISHSSKKANKEDIYVYGNISSSKNINKQIFNDVYYARVKDITFTKKIVEMADIETNTHYFYTKGTLCHNCAAFDIPYIIKRITQVLGEDYVKNLSPWRLVIPKTSKNDYGKEVTTFDIVGINSFDFLELYKKFSANESESYKLDYVALSELNDKKVEYDCSFRDLYTKYYDLFTKYNIHDVRLVGKLEKKLGFIALACTMLYRAKVTAQDVFTTVRIWDVIITNYALTLNKYVPTYLSDNSGAGSYGGGYVKDPLVGFYKWLLSIDATSLYPSIERTLNTSPETILAVSDFIKITPNDILNETPLYKAAKENAKQKNASLAANGALFSNEFQGIIPALNEKYFNERVIEKSLGKKYEKAAASISSILAARGVNI